MSNILIVTGSARELSVGNKIATIVQEELQNYDDVTATIANLKEIDLPFFDNETAPSAPNFSTSNEKVLSWTKMVADADTVLLLMPEYNHSLSGIQKNAIDWISAEWNEKPVSIIGYGWGGAALAHITAKEVFSNLKAKLLPTTTHLHFMKQLNPDGSAVDGQDIAEQIKLTLDELVGNLK
ncbi:MAG: NAD(P)H-dependent oxidoreductase [Candidatus Saccharimonadales bacterium]